MTPAQATDALSPLALSCNDMTPDRFELWVRMVCEKCQDPHAVLMASEQWATSATDTFVPAFGSWYELYRSIRRRRLDSRAALPAPKATGPRPSMRAAVDAAKAVLGNGRHKEHTPGHVDCDRCQDIEEAFMAQMPDDLGAQRLYRCPACLDTGLVELDSTGHGLVDRCTHISHQYRRDVA